MYVQFDISGDENHYNFWHSDSLYLYEPIFGVFVDCFEKSVERLNYYGPTVFRASELLRLEQALESSQRDFEQITSSDDLISKLSKLILGKNFLRELEKENYDLKTEWGTVVSSLKLINDALVELVQKCIQEKRVLWVLGI